MTTQKCCVDFTSFSVNRVAFGWHFYCHVWVWHRKSQHCHSPAKWQWKDCCCVWGAQTGHRTSNIPAICELKAQHLKDKETWDPFCFRSCWLLWGKKSSACGSLRLGRTICVYIIALGFSCALYLFILEAALLLKCTKLLSERKLLSGSLSYCGPVIWALWAESRLNEMLHSVLI